MLIAEGIYEYMARYGTSKCNNSPRGVMRGIKYVQIVNESRRNSSKGCKDDSSIASNTVILLSASRLS